MWAYRALFGRVRRSSYAAPVLSVPSPPAAPPVLTDPVHGPEGRVAWVEVGAEPVIVVRAPGLADRRLPGCARPHRDGTGVVRFLDRDALVLGTAAGPLAILDLRTGERRDLATPGHASGLAVAPDGRRVAAAFDDGGSCRVGVVDVATGALTVLSEASFAWDPAWSPDGSTLVWVEWDLPAMPWDASRLVGTEADGGGPGRRIVAGGDDVGISQPRFAPDGALGFLLDRRLHWMGSLDSAPQPFDRDPSTEHGPAPLGPGQRSWGWVGSEVVCTRGNEVVRMARDGAVRVVAPGFARAIDTTAAGTWIGVADDWNVDAHLHGIEARPHPDDATPHPEWITVRADAGAVPTLVWRAPGVAPGPAPLLVDVHGGPIGGVVADRRAAQRASYWTNRGWVVVTPGYRGTTGFGEAHRRALRGEWGVADVADVAATIRYAVASGAADPARVAISGGSAGGFTALLVAIHHPDLVRAVVSTFGVTDLLACAETTWRFESGFFDWLIGPLPGARAEYVARSPVTHADALRVPLLVFQGTDDIVVTPDQADRLVAAVRATGTTVEDVRFHGEGHGWKRPETGITELETTDAFLRRHVQDRHYGPDEQD